MGCCPVAVHRSLTCSFGPSLGAIITPLSFTYATYATFATYVATDAITAGRKAMTPDDRRGLRYSFTELEGPEHTMPKNAC
jgi:hypothetical protein